MQRKKAKKTKKEEEEQNAGCAHARLESSTPGIVDRSHWQGQGARQYLFSKSLRKERSGSEGAGDDDGGDDPATTTRTTAQTGLSV